MQNVSKEYMEAIKEYQRKMEIKMVLSDGTEMTGHDYLQSFTISEVSNSENVLTMGNVCCNQVDITMFAPSQPLALTNEKITLYSGLQVQDKIEWVCLGDYYVFEVKKDNKQKKITMIAYDAIYRCNDTYVPSITFPATLEAVIHDICDITRISLKETTFPLIEIPTVEKNSTCKEILGYMAGLLGKNAYMNRNNELEFYWYTQSEVCISQDLQYQDSFTITNDPITIHSITSGSEDNVLVSGEGYGISFGNPYMTQAILDTIYASVKDFTYLPCSLQWRGNPALTIQDIVKVEDLNGNFQNVLVMENKIVYGAGMHSEVTCLGKLQEDMVVSKSPTDIKLHKLYTTLLQAFKDGGETIMGHNGGYFTIDVNEEGFPSGWTIMDTPTLREDTHLWKMSSGGFGYSENGGRSFNNITIDMLGRISANSITTGLLQGENFCLDLVEGTITMGKRDEEGNFEEEWFSASKDGLKINAIKELSDKVDKNVEETKESITSLSLTVDAFKTIVSDAKDALVGVKNYLKKLDVLTISMFDEGASSQNNYEYKNQQLIVSVVEAGYFEFYQSKNFIQEYDKTSRYSASIDICIDSDDDTLQIPVSFIVGDKASTFTLHQELQKIIIEDVSFEEIENYKLVFNESGYVVKITNIDLILGNQYTPEMKGFHEVATELNQSYDTIEFVRKGLDEVLDDLGNYVTQMELKEYIRFDGASISLGTSASDFKTVITNSEIGFYDGATKVAYINNAKLLITDAIIKNTFRIGSFIWKPRKNNNLSLFFSQEVS